MALLCCGVSKHDPNINALYLNIYLPSLVPIIWSFQSKESSFKIHDPIGCVLLWLCSSY